MNDRQPPRAALRLLRLALPREDGDAVCGDLLEEFRRRDPAGSRAWFWREALAIAIRCGLRRRRRRIAREPSPMPIMSSLLHDLRYACRILVDRPAFTLAALATIAVAIGVNTAIFALVNTVL